MSAMNEALVFLISTIFEMYLFIMVLRVLLAFAGANYFDPFTQFIVRCTDFLVKPVRRLIPNFNGIEISTVLLIYGIECIKNLLLFTIMYHQAVLMSVLILALAETIKLFLQTLFYALILQAILSWVQANTPVSFMLYKITSPILRPIQRYCPAVGGLDISPIPAMIILQLLIILIVNPLIGMAGFAMR
jgi:YggT family protein